MKLARVNCLHVRDQIDVATSLVRPSQNLLSTLDGAIELTKDVIRILLHLIEYM